MPGSGDARASGNVAGDTVKIALMVRSRLICQNAAAAHLVTQRRCDRGLPLTYPANGMMRTNRTPAFHGLLALLLLAFALSGIRTSRAGEDNKSTPVRLSFDRPLDASMAPFVLAVRRGLFAAEALSVNMNFANGSQEAIARVASGDSEFALVDINELIRFRDLADASPVKAVFVLFNRAPYALVARKSRGIHTLSDVEGKTLGVGPSDLSFRLWPALAKANGIKPTAVRVYRMSAAVRGPILSAGQVDAVAGFSYLSAVNLRDRGVPASDLVVLRYSDFGCEAYGFAVIVNPAFAAARPQAVKGFVSATIAGTHLAIQEPERAADEIVARMDGSERDLELERLHTVILDNILSDEVRRNGIGDIDPPRFERAIDQIGQDFKFHKRPSLADIFDDSFLPPVGERLID
jgi:NitT/TauT family transport system substrate-binding protein